MVPRARFKASTVCSLQLPAERAAPRLSAVVDRSRPATGWRLSRPDLTSAVTRKAIVQTTRGILPDRQLAGRGPYRLLAPLPLKRRHDRLEFTPIACPVGTMSAI